MFRRQTTISHLGLRTILGYFGQNSLLQFSREELNPFFFFLNFSVERKRRYAKATGRTTFGYFCVQCFRQMCVCVRFFFFCISSVKNWAHVFSRTHSHTRRFENCHVCYACQVFGRNMPAPSPASSAPLVDLDAAVCAGIQSEHIPGTGGCIFVP